MRAETKRSRPAMKLLPLDSTLGPLAHARGYKTSLVAKRPKGFMTLRIVAARVSKGTCRYLFGTTTNLVPGPALTSSKVDSLEAPAFTALLNSATVLTGRWFTCTIT